MKSIIIAAGPSNRLRPLTDNLPKCMLKINGKPLIKNTVDLFRQNGIIDVSVVRGYKSIKINLPNITYFENKDFMNNNILHSLMFAREKIEQAIQEDEDIVITYSDIWYNDSVVKALTSSKKAIASVIDIVYQEYYQGRTDHPLAEAEKVIFNEDMKMLKIGKIVTVDAKSNHGEFIGLWKFTPMGAKIFLKHFDRLNTIFGMHGPYQSTKEWQKSYITDIFQEMIDQGEKLYCVTIKKNWAEFDTVQDFLRIGGEIPKDLEFDKGGKEK